MNDKYKQAEPVGEVTSGMQQNGSQCFKPYSDDALPIGAEIYATAQPVQPAGAQEPDLLDLKLPIAVRVGGGIFGKGVSLRTVANKLKLIQDTYNNDLKARMSKQSICRENETESPADAQRGPLQPDFSDAYQGAREDAEIWKKRALEAEELNRKVMASVNSPTFMGEPAQPAQDVREVVEVAKRIVSNGTKDGWFVLSADMHALEAAIAKHGGTT